MSNRFRWVFCQLETLRHCLPPSVQRTLCELPETLDETYERVLTEIKKPSREHAIRVLQCLVVAVRPLHVEELAEVLAVDFGDEEGLPKLDPHWRWEDQEQALLSSCSSLIAIVESDGSRIVEFSHLSVKEFLTSYRLASPSEDVSRYHIDLEPAHLIFAQACMSVLLRSDDLVEEGGIGNISPLAGYAAEHWVVHAQFERVSSLFLRKPMEYLFDPDKPYFAAWVQLYDIDTYPDSKSSSLHSFAVETKSDVTPLYHAALCGFEDLVEHLTLLHPQLVNTRGGYYVTPLVAALAGRHFRTAQFLDRMGADANVSGRDGETPLHSAARYGDLETVQVLLDYQANVHAHLGAESDQGRTPLREAAYNGRVEVVRVLLEHGAHLGAEDNHGGTSLHVAVVNWREDAVRVLLEGGANVGAEDNQGRTPLHKAADRGRAEVVLVLLEHGADIGAEDYQGRTPLYDAVDHGRVEIVLALLEHGANIGAKNNRGRTPLHEAGDHGRLEVVLVLLEHGANIGAEDNQGRTPLHEVADHGTAEIVRLLLEHGANANAEDKQGRTSLHEAAYRVEVVRVLLEYGANVHAEDYLGRTPLHVAAQHGSIEAVRILFEHGADVNARSNY